MESIELGIFLKDFFTSPLAKLSQKSDKAFAKVNKDIDGITGHGRKAEMSIQKINDRLDLLRKSREISIDLRSIKAANKEIKALEKEKSKLEGTSGSGGLLSGGMLMRAGIAGVALMAVRSVFQFGKRSLVDFNEEAQARAQIEASNKSMGGVSGRTTSQLENQARDLSGKTLFSVDKTLTAQSVLLTFRNIRGKLLDETTPIVQDMATKMKLDLKQASLMVGKALNEPVMGMMNLRREGVQLSKQQQEMVKYFVNTGQLAKAQAIIMHELTVEFGGSAEAAGKAGTGGFTILQNKFKELREVVGERMQKNLGGFTSKISGIIDKMTDWLKIPTSKHLEEERYRVNMLTIALTNLKLPAEQRNKIYNELNQIAPQVLAGQDKEISNIKLLKQNLEVYNKELTKTITIQAQEDILQPYKEKYQKRSTREFKTESDIANVFEDLTIENIKIGPIWERLFNASHGDFGRALEELIRLMSGQYGEKNPSVIGLREYQNKVNKLKGRTEFAKNEFLKKSDYFNKNIQTLDGLPGTGKEPAENPENNDKTDSGLTDIIGDSRIAKNITINIGKQIEKIEVSTDTAIESIPVFIEKLKKALLTVVNDANYIAE